MFKRIVIAISALAPLLLAVTAFAQAPAMAAAPGPATRINFVPGTTSFTFSANLVQGAPQSYVMTVSQGQAMYITKTGNATVQVLDSNNQPITGANGQPGPWGAKAPDTGDFTLLLNGQGPVTVSVFIPPVGQTLGLPAPLPLFRPQIRFAPGSSSFTFRQSLAQGVPVAYTLGISAGQQLTLRTEGNVTVAVLDQQFLQVLAASPQTGVWQYAIPATGDYTVVLLGTGSNLIRISIPPLGSGVSAERVFFAPGTDSITLNPPLQPNVPKVYILGAMAGQTMFISRDNGSVSVFDPQGQMLSPSGGAAGTLAFALPLSGDYLVQIVGQGPATVTFRIPPLFGF